MKDLPGLYQKPFYIKLEADHFKRGNIISMSQYEQKFIVVRVYPYRWWKKWLLKLGLRVRICEIKVKSHGNNS